jgi:hypothetical protein
MAAVRNTADVIDLAYHCLIAVYLSACNALVARYDIHGRKREVIFFFRSRTPHETNYIRSTARHAIHL